MQDLAQCIEAHPDGESIPERTISGSDQIGQNGEHHHQSAADELEGLHHSVRGQELHLGYERPTEETLDKGGNVNFGNRIIWQFRAASLHLASEFLSRRRCGTLDLPLIEVGCIRRLSCYHIFTSESSCSCKCC
jgi:hypothetical protein